MFGVYGDKEHGTYFGAGIQKSKPVGNVHYLKLVANKGLTTDYINQENGIFRKLQEESFLCCNGHSPLTQVYDVLQSLGTSVLGIAVFSAVLYKLNVAVILFIVVTTAVSFYLNKRVVKWTDEHSKERMSYVQRLNYINAISGDARSAKDIRLYPMAKWFSVTEKSFFCQFVIPCRNPLHIIRINIGEPLCHRIKPDILCRTRVAGNRINVIKPLYITHSFFAMLVCPFHNSFV